MERQKLWAATVSYLHELCALHRAMKQVSDDRCEALRSGWNFTDEALDVEVGRDSLSREVAETSREITAAVDFLMEVRAL